ncbi:LysR family transcriptional regulator [Natroniella acetigena]|uniref:winged helix-turn-helix domain-containing protein n=1 Tax=Natroniella acetigena TaxID=52004 RepID=UPI00200B7A70|nr:LysR family transcriptional regulator [Natroniella acetigena]MCK8827293.1 LysR family transcriptional regulator [Natroniella acetigena]
MEVNWKVWLEVDEKKVFGKGPWELLKNIDELGSLRQAAAVMKMSYSKAWTIISRLEANLDFELLDKQVGGSNGGGSELTTESRKLLRKYRKLERRIAQEIPKIFQEVFN